MPDASQCGGKGDASGWTLALRHIEDNAGNRSVGLAGTPLESVPRLSSLVSPYLVGYLNLNARGSQAVRDRFSHRTSLRGPQHRSGLPTLSHWSVTVFDIEPVRGVLWFLLGHTYARGTPALGRHRCGLVARIQTATGMVLGRRRSTIQDDIPKFRQRHDPNKGQPTIGFSGNAPHSNRRTGFDCGQFPKWP